MPQKNLSEKDFIHEGYKQDPYPFWFWLTILTAFLAIVWGGYTWYANTITHQYLISPFLQVTNREMSLFLWQNPQYMRIESKSKTAYLPGFQYMNKVSLDLPFADEYVAAPPEILFLYHTWHRLLSPAFIPRIITVEEFKQFLNYAEEWYPRNWPAAPPEYVKLVDSLANTELKELKSGVPLIVQQAFVGWKNFMKEGDAINAMTPTYTETEKFLLTHKTYARSYWQNIVGPSYLKSLAGAINKEAFVPKEEISPFLRVALYNFKQKT